MESINAEPSGSYFWLYEKKHEDNQYNYTKIHTPNPLAERLVRQKIVSAGKTVLELGCGSGRDMISFVSAGARGIGVDMSITALIKLLQSKKERCICSPLEIHNTDFSEVLENTFGCDVIYSYSTLHYYTDDDLSRLLRLIHDALKHDGVFAFAVKSQKDGFFSAKNDETLQTCADGVRRRFFTEDELFLLLEEARFDVIDHRKTIIKGYDFPGNVSEFHEIIAMKAH